MAARTISVGGAWIAIRFERFGDQRSREGRRCDLEHGSAAAAFLLGMQRTSLLARLRSASSGLLRSAAHLGSRNVDTRLDEPRLEAAATTEHAHCDHGDSHGDTFSIDCRKYNQGKRCDPRYYPSLECRFR
jgi:hypothetical protein